LRMAEPEENSESLVASEFKSENEASRKQVKNLVRDVDAEQKWRDTEIRANTKFDVSNFASVFVVVPGRLWDLQRPILYKHSTSVSFKLLFFFNLQSFCY